MLNGLKRCLLKLARKKPEVKEDLKHHANNKPAYKTHEARKKEAMQYVVKQYFTSRRREAALKTKIENFGTVRRTIYEVGVNLHFLLSDISIVVKEVAIKPVALVLGIFCSVPSAWIASWVLAPPAATLVEQYVAPPLSAFIYGPPLFFVFLSPLIATVAYYWRLLKKDMRRLREEYGVSDMSQNV